MGLVLLIPGLVFLANGTEWFSGEDKVGAVLTVVGAALLLIQFIWFVFVAAKMNSARRDFLDRW